MNGIAKFLPHTITMPTFLMGNYTPYLWMIAALALLLLETAAPGLFFFISFSLGAAAAATAAFLGASFNWQCAIGLLSSIAAFFAIQRRLKGDGLSHAESANAEIMAEIHGTITRAIIENGTGSVKVGGETWPAKTHDGHPLTVGTRIRIIRIEGNKLIVKAVKPQQKELASCHREK